MVSPIVGWLRARLVSAAARGFVVELNGSLSAAVTARVCQLAAPGQVVGVWMPGAGDPADDGDTRLIADHYQLPIARVDLGSSADRLVADARTALQTLPPAMMPATGTVPGESASAVNLTSRLRMTTLYFFADSLNALVAGSGTRSDLIIGAFTKHGDGGVDLLPLGHLFESQVRALANDLGIPAPLLEKSATNGRTMTSSADDGFRGADLEGYLTRGPESVSPAVALRLERRIRASAHKRALAPTPETPLEPLD